MIRDRACCQLSDRRGSGHRKNRPANPLEQIVIRTRIRRIEPNAQHDHCAPSPIDRALARSPVDPDGAARTDGEPVERRLTRKRRDKVECLVISPPKIRPPTTLSSSGASERSRSRAGYPGHTKLTRRPRTESSPSITHVSTSTHDSCANAVADDDAGTDADADSVRPLPA